MTGAPPPLPPALIWPSWHAWQAGAAWQLLAGWHGAMAGAARLAVSGIYPGGGSPKHFSYFHVSMRMYASFMDRHPEKENIAKRAKGVAMSARRFSKK